MSSNSGKEVRFYPNYSVPVVVLKYLGRGGKKYFHVPSVSYSFICGGRYGYLCVPLEAVNEFLDMNKNGAKFFAYANPNETRQVQDEIVRRYNLIQERLSKSGLESNTAFDVLQDFFGSESKNNNLDILNSDEDVEEVEDIENPEDTKVEKKPLVTNTKVNKTKSKNTDLVKE